VTTKITRDDVLRAVAGLDRNRRNPVKDETCVYTSSRGNHCIAGQIITDLGGRVPGYRSKWNTQPLTSIQWNPEVGVEIDGDAFDLLVDLQETADSPITTIPTTEWRTWGEVLDEVGVG
jgi:hypothetical protein